MGRKASKIVQGLSSLPKRKCSPAQKKIIDETVDWYRAERAAGNELPSKAAVHRYLREEHGVSICLTTFKSYLEG